MNWLTFTEISFERFREAMKLLLEVDKINAKFEAIQDRMGARFDRELSRLIEKIISILNRVADGR
jgi:predicted nuclease with TOPRIM domain